MRPHQMLPQRFHLLTGAVGCGGLGAEAVRAQPWTATPATVEARRTVDPQVASR